VFHFTPHIGRIDRVFLDFGSNLLYAASLTTGTIAKCNPSTGKVDKDLIYTTMDQEAALLSAIHIERNRIVAGFPSGALTLINNPSHRDVSISAFRNTHDSPVCAFEVLRKGSLLVVGSIDGVVTVFSFTKMKRIAILTPPKHCIL